MIQKSTQDDITIIQFKETDRITALNAEELKQEINPLFEDQSGLKMVIDFEGVDFVDSTGFGAFLSIMKTASTNKGELRLCNLNPEVHKLFKLLHLDNVFEIYSSLNECIDSFK